MSKPIEPGCLAMIINTKRSNGKIVTVGRLITNSPIYLSNDGFMYEGPRWEINKSLPTRKGVFIKHACEYNLLRIDDHESDDFDEEVKWEFCEKHLKRGITQ